MNPSFVLPERERGGGRMGIIPWHQVGSPEGVAEFVNSFVYGSSRFANVHEIVFADRLYPVETGGLCSLRPDAGLIENPKKIRNTLA